jgi:hypothetical protein
VKHASTDPSIRRTTTNRGLPHRRLLSPGAPARRGALRATLVLLWLAATLAGCTTLELDHATQLNRQLSYLPWGMTASKPDGLLTSFKVQSGMRVVFATTPILNKGQNMMPAPASVSTWEVPEPQWLDPIDFFYIGWLVESAIPADNGLPVVTPFDINHEPADTSSPPTFLRPYFNMILSTLEIDFTHAVSGNLHAARTPPISRKVRSKHRDWHST